MVRSNGTRLLRSLTRSLIDDSRISDHHFLLYFFRFLILLFNFKRDRFFFVFFFIFFMLMLLISLQILDKMVSGGGCCRSFVTGSGHTVWTSGNFAPSNGIRKMIEDGQKHYEKIFLEIEKASNRLEAAEKELNEREKQLQQRGTQRATQFEAEWIKFNNRIIMEAVDGEYEIF
ncbi:hypothetical protein Ddye_024719 [Dipteronia dyeriana]|uniref:Uncharacterized protein n=1 Tax=Dipteronia dyeriana TaxID=168575 RepID=A0AAD9TVI5_9ROSI|nr:hypothetical protein Ddye_024719 [Dipteronia dyeriana]